MKYEDSLWERKSGIDKRLFFVVMLLTAILFVCGVVGYGKYGKDIESYLYSPALRWGTKKSEIANVPPGRDRNDMGATDSGVISQSKKKIRETVAIYNGTTRIGISGKFGNVIMGKFSDVNVVTLQNAAKKDYPRSFVVDIKGSGSKAAKELAYELDCPLVNIMPDGEATPSTEVLVVLGGDYR